MNKEKIQYYCKCGKQICWRTALYGSGNCHRCIQFGRKNPKHSLRMIGKNNPMFGKHHTFTTKEKISKINKGLKRTEEVKLKISTITKGKNNPFFGKHHNKETKLKISKFHTGLKASKETKQKLSDMRKGNKNPNWKNGISKLPYSFEFNEKLKLKIRKRDDYICQKCGMTEEEHLIVYGKVLTIHHIDYNKENCEEDNLITTCSECNSRVNFNRNYWTEYFKNLIIKKEK